MRKRFFPKFLVIAFAALCITSCKSVTDKFVYQGLERSGIDRLMYYTDVINENGPSVELVYNLAYSYLESGDWDKAIETAREASDLYPEMIRFDYLILYAYRESGRMYSYEKELERLARKYPANNDIAEMLLTAYKGARRPEAIPAARRLLQREPSNQIAIASLAEFYGFYKAISPKTENTAPEPWDPGVKEIYNITKTIEDRLLT